MKIFIKYKESFALTYHSVDITETKVESAF